MNKLLFSKIFFTLACTAIVLMPLSSYARTSINSNILGHVCLSDSDCNILQDYVCEPLGTGYRLNISADDPLTKLPKSPNNAYDYQKICKLKNNVEGCKNGKAGMNATPKVLIQKNGIMVTADELRGDSFCSGSLQCNTEIGGTGICTQDFGKSDAKNLDLGEETSDIKGKILRFVTLALSFLAILGVVIVIYAGASWASSLGNEERVTKSRKMLIAAAIGLLIITIAWTITSWVINFGGQIS